MEKLKVNVEKSEHVFSMMGEQIKKGQCYTNCFHAGSTLKWLLNEDVCVVYGYLSLGTLGIYVRHCVLFIDNEIVDATIPACGHVINPELYDFIPFESMTFDSFVERIEGNDLHADLPNSKGELRCYLDNFHQMKQGKTINEYDFFKYIRKKLDKHNSENKGVDY